MAEGRTSGGGTTERWEVCFGKVSQRDRAIVQCQHPIAVDAAVREPCLVQAQQRTPGALDLPVVDLIGDQLGQPATSQPADPHRVAVGALANPGLLQNGDAGPLRDQVATASCSSWPCRL